MGDEKNIYLQKKETKANFWIKKDCAINSLKEVEHFLHNLHRARKHAHLYKFLR